MEEGTLRKKCCVCSERYKKLIAYRVNIVLEHDSKNPWICDSCRRQNNLTKKAQAAKKQGPQSQEHDADVHRSGRAGGLSDANTMRDECVSEQRRSSVPPCLDRSRQLPLLNHHHHHRPAFVREQPAAMSRAVQSVLVLLRCLRDRKCVKMMSMVFPD